jgi:hypothetical protein
MMIPEPFGYMLRLLVAKLPGWFIRYFYKPDKIANSIDIDLRSNAPINISFGMEIPEISLYFHIYNRSPFNLILDRLLIDFWVGQPTLKGAILRRYVIPKGESVDNVYFSCPLTSQQQNQIRGRCNGQLLSVPVSLTITAYLESKVGMICLDKRIDRSDVPCK